MDLNNNASDQIWDFAEQCLLLTADSIRQASLATESELLRATSKCREEHALSKPAELIEVLARVQGHSEEHLSGAIMAISNRVADSMQPYSPFLPFAGKLIAPSAFYDSFEYIHRLAKVLLSPVIYAEDSDSIGTASINPVATLLLGSQIQSLVSKRFGIRPFMSTARLDYESWSFLCRKHFEL